jgi:hypothetical protein
MVILPSILDDNHLAVTILASDSEIPRGECEGFGSKKEIDGIEFGYTRRRGWKKRIRV